MSFSISQQAYDGPLHLLLELIEKRALAIKDVSLAQVTDEYVAYLNMHEPPVEELADFLLIATRLLLIKSHELLPKEAELEEESLPSLATQLQLYKLFVGLADVIDEVQQSTKQSFARAHAEVKKLEGFILPETCTTAALAQALSDLLRQLEPFFQLQQAAIERVVSVKERLSEIHDVLVSRSRIFFRDIIGFGRSKVDIVVSFLALLELVKQRSVHVLQQDAFGEIEISKKV